MKHKTVQIIILSVTLAAALQPSAFSQTDEQLKAMTVLCGAESEEDLDSQEVERLAGLLSRPIEINMASRSRLLASGLFTQYQVASLTDYRSRSGDVLSFAELAELDGFGKEYAASLSHFISLRSNSLPGQPAEDTLRFSQELIARGAFKNGEYNYGVKYKLLCEERAEVSMAARSAYPDKRQFPPSAYSLNLAYYGRKTLGKLIFGDFNARFGQGLSLWSGFYMTGLSSSLSFCRRPAGLSPSWSYSGTGTHRGVAADFQAGKFVLSVFSSFPGLRDWCEDGKRASISFLPGANLAWFGRNGQASVTAYYLSSPVNMPLCQAGGKVSGDCRYSMKGVDLFGEAAFDFAGSSVACVSGAAIPLKNDIRLSFVGRFYPDDFSSEYSGGVSAWSGTSNEYGFGTGLERYGALFTADYAQKAADGSVKQFKLLFKMPVQLAGNIVLSIRASERIRPYGTLRYRTGARCDLDYSSAGLSARYGSAEQDAWTARIRLESLTCLSTGLLSYMEAGRRQDHFSAYLRCTVFFIDNWDDRIYSYERDAPGNFTVPAFYGRGFSLSGVSGLKIRLADYSFKFLRLYLRSSWADFRFMKKPKPATFEIKLQASIDL